MLKSLSLAAALSLALAVPTAAWACGEENTTVTQVTPKEGAELQKKGTTFVDANGKDTRSKYGVIPGAILLTSYSEYDANKELPGKKDQPLVFYCANTKCGASFEAAKKAQAAGYTNVAVLPDGIKGWKDAGLPTQTLKANNS